MTLWDVCIRRPVFTIMLVAAPIILGVASYLRLGVELFPNVDLPFVTISTTLRGASVEEMEASVTKPIEEAVNTISGIDELRSTTREGISSVIIQFKLEKNGNVAAQEVEAKIRTIISRLPDGIDQPIVDKIAIDAAPVMTIAVSGARDLREVTEIARKKIKEDLETISGVGSVVLAGGRQRAVHVILDPDKLHKYERLTVEDVRQALLRENQEQPGGRVDRGQTELVLRTLGRVERPADFRRLIIANRHGQPVRIEDVGRVEDSFEEPRSLSRLWSKEGAQPIDEAGRNAVSLVVQKQSGSNTVAVVHAVKRRLAQLVDSVVPPDISAEVIRDQSRFIENSMDEVKTHLVLAAVLVSASILLFLRDWRTTVIATLSIPTSLIGAFAFMDAMGFTINNFTMIGLILAVGIVVDDAVVVHENIFRHMEEKGLPAMQAAASATREIALAVIATTLSLVVVFAPIAFMGGTVGRFFSCFGYVVGFSVLMSMFVSFTMTPMLCSRFLRAEEGFSSKSGWLWQAIEGGYIAILKWSMRHRWVIVLASLAVVCSTPFLFMAVGKNFVPKDDQSEFEVAVTLPEGFTLDRGDRLMTEIDRRLRRLRGVVDTFVTVGETSDRVAKGQGDVTRASIYCRLTDLRDRAYSQFDVMAEARAVLADYPDLRSSVQDVKAISAQGFKQAAITLNLVGPDVERLQGYAETLAAWMRQADGFIDVDTSLSLRKPELRIRPDRERMSDLGVSLESVAGVTNMLVGGVPVSKYKEQDEQYDVWLRAEAASRADRDAVGRMGVPARNAPTGVAALESVASIDPALGPNTIDRFGRQRLVSLSANLQGRDLSSAIADLRAELARTNLPPEYKGEFVGDAKTLAESNSNFAVGFLLAIIFMYMILAAQFESLLHPISILAALPLTLPFAVLSLILMNTSLDIFAMLGLFMLFGVVKKNGILQVDYTNQLRAQGMDRATAIIDANRARLRPILMTTVMLVAAMGPMALGQGPGAGSRSSMAKVILGGQSLSLLLTLLVTPVAYSLFDGLQSRLGSLFGRRSSTVAPPQRSEAAIIVEAA